MLKLTYQYIRSPGPGGQKVNKVATTVVLRCHLNASTLPLYVKDRLKTLAGSKLSSRGIVTIKASRYRTQERNKADALARLHALIDKASAKPKKRRKTKPSKASIEKRISNKKLHGKRKALRNKIYE